MRISERRNLVVETVARGTRVVRFTQPDLRDQLDTIGNMGDCPVFRELQDAALRHLAEGETLVLNLALVERFPTALYACLLRVRKAVLARRARLVLCRLSPEHEEVFQLFQATRLFPVARTEAEAVREPEAWRHVGTSGTDHA